MAGTTATLERPGLAYRRRQHRTRSWRWPGWASAVYGALAGAVLFVLAHDAMPDDAWISLSYARTLATSGTWGVYPGVTANSQTGPLNVWLLAGGIVVAGHPVVITGVLLAATLAATGWWADGLRRDLGLSPWLPYVLVTLLVSSPLLVSTVGLETYLGCAVLVGVVRHAFAGRPVTTGALVGLAVLTRPDLAVPGAVLALGLLTRPEPLAADAPLRRVGRLLVAAAVTAVVVLPWHLWAWYHLGGFVPDTALLKTSGSGGGPGSYSMLTAPVGFWAAYFPVATSVAAVPVVAGVVCAAVAVARRQSRWATAVLVLVVAGWAHLLALWAIGAAAGGWYYGVIIGCSAAAVAITVSVARWPARITTAAVLAGAVVLTVASLPAPWTIAPIVANLARSPQYLAVGAQLGALTGGRPITSPDEVGAFAFSSASPVVDQLTTPALARPLLDHRYQVSGPTMRAFLRWNWSHRVTQRVPTPGYRLDYLNLRPPLPGRIVASWPIDTPATGQHTLVLTDLRAHG